MKPMQFVSINPDLRDGFGHYLHHDRRVRGEVEARGSRFTSLASLAFEDGDCGRGIVPTFSDPTSLVGRRAGGAGALRRFRAELTDGLRALRRGPGGDAATVAYMYLGSAPHARVALEVAAGLPDAATRFVINLFYAYHDVGPGSVADAGTEWDYRDLFLSRGALAPGRRMTLCAESDILASELAALGCTGVREFPFMDVTAFTAEDLEGDGGRQRAAGPVRVCYPGTAQAAKGFGLVLAALRGGLGREPGVRFVVREHAPDGMPAPFRREVDALRDAVEFVPGVLSNRLYKRMFLQADLVLVPYRSGFFHGRTSAVFADAIALGKPVVATRETWAGRETERLGVGVTFPDGDAPQFVAAIETALRDLDRYTVAARAQRANWRRRHGPGALVDFLAGCAAG